MRDMFRIIDLYAQVILQITIYFLEILTLPHLDFAQLIRPSSYFEHNYC